MSLFLEFHLIQNFAPSNLNRDDTGAPKDAFFGGHRRARVSSQCFKRAIRLATDAQGLIGPKFQGVRTQKLFRLLTERLAERGRTEAQGRIEAALNAAGLALKEDNKTQYLLFLGDAEISGFADLIDHHWDELTAPTPAASGEKKGKKEAKASAPPEVVKKAKALLDGGKAVDVALFGRMLADMPEVSRDAACQVAHAISTHRVEREFDYFTAVDDMNTADEAGAGMIGQVEFNSATFYRYAVIDANKLLANLQGDKDLTLAAIEAFAQSVARAIPTGKQNTFAAHNPPSFVGLVLRSGGLLSLANAFEKPVSPRSDQSLTSLSVAAMADYEEKFASAYGSDGDAWCHLDLTGSWPKEKGEAQTSLNALSTWARSKVAESWGA
jgi:CRISPR system Cascade subunit CasC